MEFTLFDTALGRCSIAWGAHGIVAVQLPEADERALRARIARAVPGALKVSPPADVNRAIEEIAALLATKRRMLAIEGAGAPTLFV